MTRFSTWLTASYLLSDDAEDLISSSLLVLGEYRQNSTERSGRWSSHGLGRLLVEVWNVEGVLEHRAELDVVDAAVRTAVEADDSLAFAGHQLRLAADGQLQCGQELSLGDASAAQSIVVLEELRRPDPSTIHRNLIQIQTSSSSSSSSSSLSDFTFWLDYSLADLT